MGLIKGALGLGAGAYIINKAGKAYGEHEKQKWEHQQHMAQQQRMPPQQQFPQQPRDASSAHGHQQWCNGNCGGQCMGGYQAPAPLPAQQTRGIEYQDMQSRYSHEKGGLGMQDTGKTPPPYGQ